MLNDFSCSCPVYIACGYTDLRRGIDGLATLVKSQFQMDPFQRALFLFCGRRRDRIKGNRQISLRIKRPPSQCLCIEMAACSSIMI